MKKGKDCVAIAKNALDDISSGREAMALNKLSALQADGIFLADTAKQLAKRLEAVEKHYQQKDSEILREIGDLSRRENELKGKKSREESQLAAHQNVLQDNQNRLSSEESRLRDAERKLKNAEEEENKRIKIGAAVGGAILGVLGIGIGAGIGYIINECKKEEEDARDAVNRRRNDVDDAQSAINASRSRISNTESQIRNLTSQIESMKQQRLQSHKKVDEVRALIVLVKKSVQFWLLFKQISENGVDLVALLQKIVTKAAEKGDYRVIQSKSSERIANTFIEAWEEMAMECEGSNHILEIDDSYSQYYI